MGSLGELRRHPDWMFLEEQGSWEGSEEGRVQKQLVGAAGSVEHSRQERSHGLGKRSEPSLSSNPWAPDSPVTQVSSESL